MILLLSSTTLKMTIAFFVSSMITSYLLPLLKRVAKKLHIIDTPDGKLKQQKEPIPYLGGIAIYIGFLVALSLTIPFENNLFFLLIGLTLLIGLGLIDDIIILTPSQKLFGQCIAVFCFLKGGFYLKETFFEAHSSFAIIFWMIISFFWMISVINAFNLVDVMDGLAGTIAMMSTFGFLWYAYIFGNSTVSILLTAFLGALSAFLYHNFFPATVYLGDSGSLFLGGLLSIIPFLLPWGSFYQYGYLVPPLLLFIPLFEELSLIIIRSIKNIPFYRGSPHHFCHYLQKKGWSVKKIIFFVTCFHLLLIPMGAFILLGFCNLFQIALCSFFLIFLWTFIIYL